MISPVALDNIITNGIIKNRVDKQIRRLEEEKETPAENLRIQFETHFKDWKIGEYIDHKGYRIIVAKLWKTKYLKVIKLGDDND